METIVEREHIPIEVGFVTEVKAHGANEKGITCEFYLITTETEAQYFHLDSQMIRVTTTKRTRGPVSRLRNGMHTALVTGRLVRINGEQVIQADFIAIHPEGNNS